MVQTHKWTFPNKEFTVMRIESLIVGILAIFIFIVAITNVNGFAPSLLLTVLFLAIYIFISALIQKIRMAQETYEVDGTHLKIHKKTRFKSSKIKIPLKKINMHKLDRLFLGGYILTDKGRHSIFFNTVEELHKFEKMVKSGMRKKK